MGAILLASATLADPQLPPAGDHSVQVAAEASFDRYGKFDAKIRSECGFERQLPYAIARFNANIELVPGELHTGRVLELSILLLTLPTAIVNGKLTRGDEVLGTFQARGNPRPFTAVGTCGLVLNMAERIADDIASFVAAPTMDARLGTQ